MLSSVIIALASTPAQKLDSADAPEYAMWWGHTTAQTQQNQVLNIHKKNTSSSNSDQGVNVSPPWNIVPSLESEQKVTVDHISNEKTQGTSLDKVLQVSDIKTSTKTVEQSVPQDTTSDKRPDFVLENTDYEKQPRNVVFLLIAESDQHQKNLWKDFKASYSFPVEGFLQNGRIYQNQQLDVRRQTRSQILLTSVMGVNNCHNVKIEASRLSLDSPLISGDKDKECDCERYLRSNVAALMSWARDVGRMTTGALLNTNFTIPSVLGYEEPVSMLRDLDELDENTKPDVHKTEPEIRSDWYLIDLGKPATRSPSLTFTANIRENDREDPTWNVFDVFYKIRMAMIRSMFESLAGNASSSEEPAAISRSHPLPSNLADTINELKSIQNEKGFVLVAAAPANELNSVMETLQREVRQDTLVVVAGVCTHDAKPIPFFGQGPDAKLLHEAVTIWDLPTTIRNIIATGCQDGNCRRRHDIAPPPIRQPDVVLQEEVKEKVMLLIQPSEEMSKQIRVELNEDVTTRDKDVEIIKEWLAKQPHLPKFEDDHRIMTFLRGSKFSLEKCKRKLDMYFTMRAAIPEFFSNRDVTRPEMRGITKIVQIPPLPGLTKNGRRVIVMRGLDKDHPTPNVAEAMKLVLMIGDIRLKEEAVGVAGDVYILDASVATPSHFAKFTPAIVKKFLVCVQEAYPVKLKEVHVVNVSPLVDTIVNFVKPFLKEKIRNRIFMHSDMKTLYEYIPKEILPSEYGGDAGPIQAIHDIWMQKLEEYGPWFKEQESVRTNEALRPGKPKTHDDLFGLDGSFRQLAID
ncbi:Alpha-tocopherol transfer protein-like [Dufourea novaeangliae]|uniref:Alpha-tocopherol transfer protein-like n=2 Tax=Dufourea novaeangliae TaxID=178035 RepID=A0A154PFM2_DUFNO|nr:Alpha-tocopherol transfer protein-like [Dufourea novaeangliae]